MLTNYYDDMNPFYNSYRDTLDRVTDHSSMTNHIYWLASAICDYFGLPTVANDFMKASLTARIQGPVRLLSRIELFGRHRVDE